MLHVSPRQLLQSIQNTAWFQRHDILVWRLNQSYIKWNCDHERAHIDRRDHVVFSAMRMLLGVSGTRLDEKRFDRLVEQQPELLHVFVQRAVRLVDRLLQRVEVYVIPARNLYERLTTTQLSAFNTGDHM